MPVAVAAAVVACFNQQHAIPSSVQRQRCGEQIASVTAPAMQQHRSRAWASLRCCGVPAKQLQALGRWYAHCAGLQTLCI